MAKALRCSLKTVLAWNRIPTGLRKCFGTTVVQRSNSGEVVQAFDEKMLEILVCPLSKKPLRYDRNTNELVSDEIGVVYPIVNGIPNLVPQDARTLVSGSPLSDGNLKKPDS